MKKLTTCLLILVLIIPNITIAEDTENFYTRAEFSKIVYELIFGDKNIPNALPLGNIFDDVPDDHWVCKYLSLIIPTRIVYGYGDGTFRPDNLILNEEAVKMLVAALGYNSKVSEVSKEKEIPVYPFGYLEVAEEIGVMEDVEIVVGEYLTKDILCKLVNNSLDIQLMSITGNHDVIDKTFRTGNWQNKSVYYNGEDWIIDEEEYS